METLFQISNLLVMPFWLLLILLPHWRWTQRIAATPWIVAPAALLYAALVIPSLLALLPLLMGPSLPSIAALLGTPAGATIAWVHFLAFDLFVGRWAYLESRRLGISAWLVSPVLFLILMVGPLGLLIFLVVRAVAPTRATLPAPLAA
ncbi:MAG: ABA4-like family protein [Caldilineaceae bacterium]